MNEAIVLGSAQDGGLPHAGCLCRNCETARTDIRFRRMPASIGLIGDGSSLMIDATNDFPAQMHLLWQASGSPLAAGRHGYDPPNTILLTHAHTGHYVGLWHLDRSVLAARAVRVVGSPALIGFLKSQEPWSWMSRAGFIQFTSLEPCAEHELMPGLRVSLIPVPHRAEMPTDTVAVTVDGPRGRLLYLPDIDAWEQWDRDIAEIAAACDVAIVDGCFWEPFHIPGVPHPPIRETMRRLGPVVAAGRTRIMFTHLNHSNPACDESSDEAREIVERGFEIAREGVCVSL